MAVFDLFVSEDGLVDWAPPLVGFFLIGEAFFVEFQKAPLGPAVVFGVGSVNFSRPVDCVTEAFSLFAEVFDVSFCCFFWGNSGFYGVIFSRKAKGIIAKGTEDVKTFLGIVAGEDVDNCEVTDVADVEASAGRIWKHFGKELFRARIRVFCCERMIFFPEFLPFFFNFKRFISIHRINYNIKEVFRGG